MRKRKYLKNIEDIEALRNTDTKIRFEYDNHGVAWKEQHYQFVNGVLCGFWDGKLTNYNVMLSLDHGNYYIEVEDEPSEDWIGKLGWFWDNTKKAGVLDFLEKIRDTEVCRYVTKSTNLRYNHFRPLTPEEVEKYTGYKVAKE